MDIENFIEDFRSSLITKEVTERWTLMYKDIKVEGTYTHRIDSRGNRSKEVLMDEYCQVNLTEDGISEILEYVESII